MKASEAKAITERNHNLNAIFSLIYKEAEKGLQTLSLSCFQTPYIKEELIRLGYEVKWDVDNNCYRISW